MDNIFALLVISVPIISFNVVGMEKMTGFKITVPMAINLVKAVLYGENSAIKEGHIKDIKDMLGKDRVFK